MAGYTIKKGDTIYSIAKAYGVSPSVLMFTNKISNEKNIKPGQVLSIPVIKNVKNDATAGLDTVSFSKKPVATAKNAQASVQNKPKKVKSPTVSQKPAAKTNPFTPKTTGASTKKYSKDELVSKIKTEAKNQGVDENLALAVVEQESQFKPDAKSHTGAAGLFQLTQIAAKQVNGEKTCDVDKNIETGTKYLKWCLDHTQTKEEALVAYNRGLTAMKNAKRNGTPIDSITDKKGGKGYAKNVLEIYEKNKKA